MDDMGDKRKCIRNPQDDVIRVWLARDDVVKQLRPCDVIDYLRQEDVLTETDQELIMLEKTTAEKVRYLLDLIYVKGSRAVSAFLTALDETYRHLYQQIINTIVTDAKRRRFIVYRAGKTQKLPVVSHTADPVFCEGVDAVDSGSLLISRVSSETTQGSLVGSGTMQGMLDKLRQVLCDFYTHELSSIRPVPWNDEVTMDMDDFYHDIVLLDITNRTSGQQSETQAQPASTKVKEVQDLDKLLGDQERDQRRILIEGEAGIGKSTLCSKIALDWASAKSKNTKPLTNWTARFDHVINLPADSLRDTLSSSMSREILPEDVVGLSSEQLDLIFLDSGVQERTLLVCDAYDEAHDKTLLQDVWSGKILRQCTVLVTARPGQAADLLRKVEKRCIIQGFSQISRDSYIERYISECGCQTGLSTMFHKVESLLGHLTFVPLYVSLLCMLLEEKADLPDTRTKLLTEVILLAKEWAMAKQKTTVEQINERMQKLAKHAFDSLCNPSLSTDKRHLHQQIELSGLVVLERGKSKLNKANNVKFVHKIFQEYLAAKYLTCLEFENMKGEMDRLPEEERRSVVVFLAGLLSDNPHVSLLRFYTDFVCEDLKQRSLFNTHSVHTGLQCLAETGCFDNISSIVDRLVPEQFHFISDECCQCLAGLANVCGVCHNCSDLAINTSDISCDKANSESLKKELTTHKAITSVLFNSQLPSAANIEDSVAFYLPVLSRLEHLYVYCGDSPVHRRMGNIEAFRNERIRLRSLVFKGSNMRHWFGAEHTIPHLETLLIGVLNLLHPCLRTLILKDVTIRSDVCSRFGEQLRECTEKLHVVLLHCLSFSFGGFRNLIQSFLAVDQLKHIEIIKCFEFETSAIDKLETDGSNSPFVAQLKSPKLTNTTTDLPVDVFNVISQNKLETLVLNHQSADWSALVASLKNSSQTLSHMDLSYTKWEEPRQFQAMAPVFQQGALSKLVLKQVAVDHKVLIRALKATANVQHLDLSQNEIGGLDTFSELCQCLADKESLKHLLLDCCGITDQTVCLLYEVVKHNSLETISWEANDIVHSDEACEAIAGMLAEATSLVRLVLSVGSFTKQRMDVFVEVCQALKRLLHLKIITRPSVELQELMLACSTSGSERITTKLHRLIPHLKSVKLSMTLQMLRKSTYETPERWHSRFRDICLKYGNI